MRPISFDFMTRKLKQVAREAFVALKRNVHKERTPEEIEKLRKDAEWRKQFIPVTRWGSFLPRKASAGDSRQVRRHLQRVAAFNAITERYRGEPRQLRRKLAFDMVRNLSKKVA